MTCVPLLGVCDGESGYDAVHGKCHVLLREMCSADGDYICLPGLVLEALGDGVPSMIVIISYSMVYKNLSEAKMNAETWSLKRAVLILGFCYFIFIIPHAIFEWLPDDVTMNYSLLVLAALHCQLLHLHNLLEKSKARNLAVFQGCAGDCRVEIQ